MKAFMDKDFLLSTPSARHLYHDFAAPMPIIDYHCHLDPREIAEDRRFDTITQVWLGGDHYKWRLMRSAGVEERFITGDADDREKFQKWAETIGLAIGNPLYHWSHLELRRYFGYDGTLNADTAEEVWQLCNRKLRDPSFSARGLIRQSNVRVICTTDDPADTLEWHERIAADGFETRVLPTFRPDRAMGILKPDYPVYIAALGKAAGMEIAGFADLLEALRRRLDRFAAMGCRISDHGVDAVYGTPLTDAEADAALRARLAGGTVTEAQRQGFQTAVMVALGREYARRGMVMQIHFGVARNHSQRIFRALGPDAGVDAIGSQVSIDQLAAFLNLLDETGELPRTVLYSLNPHDNAAIESVMGCFQTGEAFGKLQHGSAWWFNDHKQGMTEQMTSLANEGMLATFVGMLTDSRSFLSYTRHEYFRRILCELIGGWVENGEYPADDKALRQIVEGICYRNARRFLGLDQ